MVKREKRKESVRKGKIIVVEGKTGKMRSKEG